MSKKLILASQSPRRKQLLEMAEIEFDVFVIPTDEIFPDELPVTEAPLYIADQKAKAVQAVKTQAIILAADTVVILENELIGKPTNESDAIAILQKLSGKTHQVITGVVIREGKKINRFSATTHVSFNELSENQIRHYVTQYKPYDKAGAYAIQEWIGAIGINRIEGDFYNVMGLPINKVVQALTSIGL
jgi:septum formation protein